MIVEACENQISIGINQRYRGDRNELIGKKNP